MDPSTLELTAAAREPWRAVLAEGRWAVLLLLCGGVWLHAADSLVVATTMPSVVAELGGIAWVGWSLALYEVASIVCGALGALVAARHGLGRALGFAMLAFALGCLASGLAADMGWFLAGRTIQGAGGGAMVALSHVAVTRAFPERHWTPIYAVISVVWGVSALVGPLIGGFFAEAGLWRWAYLAFALQAALLLPLAPLLLGWRHSRSQAAVGGVPWRALGFLALAVVAVAAAGVVEAALAAAGLALLGLLLLWLFARVDSLAVSPLLPHASVALPRVRAGLVMVLCFSVAGISFTLYGPLLLARLHGLGPLATGLLVAIESIAWSVAALAVARVRDAGEGRWLRRGAAAIVAGLLVFAVAVPWGPIWLIALAAALTGAGFGLFWSFLIRRVVAAALPTERDRAAGAVPTLQMLGYALGAALAGIVANALGFTLQAELRQVEQVALWLFLAFLPLALAGLRAAFLVAR